MIKKPGLKSITLHGDTKSNLISHLNIGTGIISIHLD